MLPLTDCSLTHPQVPQGRLTQGARRENPQSRQKDAMPPGVNSRHAVTPMIARIDDGLTFLLDREPYRYVPRPDNRRVVVQQGDTWHSLAARHLHPIARPQDLWWLICDFQPTPVLDPTAPIAVGSVVFIPSPEFVQGTVLTDLAAEISVI